MTGVTGEAHEVTVTVPADPGIPDVVIWVVEHAGNLFVRSYLGEAGRWYRSAHASGELSLSTGEVTGRFSAVPVEDGRTQRAVSDAYRHKYKGMGRWLDAMVTPEVENATLRLDPM